MAKALLLDETLEKYYCVNLNGQMHSESNSEDVKRMKKMLSKAMNSTLTERQYSCLKMYYFDSMTMKEIAKTLGLHQSTVSRHVHAAKVKLEKLRAFVD